MKGTLRSGAVLLGTAFRADPIRAAAVFVLTIVAKAEAVVFPVALKLILDAVLEQNRTKLWVAAGAFALVSAVGFLAAWISFTMSVTLQERTGLLVDQRLISLAGGIDSLEHHERADYLDQIEMLRSQRQLLADGSRAVVETVGICIQFGAVLAVLGSIHPVLLLLPVFGIPSLMAAGRAENMRQAAMEQTTEAIRLSRHFYDLATQASPAKELRIFGLGRTIVGRHRSTWDDVDVVRTRARARGAAITSAGWAVFAIGYVLAIAFVIRLAMDGRVGVSTVLLAISVGAQVNLNVQGVVQIVGWYLMTVKVVSRYLWLVDYAADAVESIPDPAVVPVGLRDGIRLDGVGFSYPGTEQPVLHDVSVHLPAGATVAVVGENGAGKTTLIKLLCRFYEPTIGSITVDGVDLRRVPAADWRARMAAGFQDFARLELRARESVGVGDLPLLDDVPAVIQALERASAVDIADGLPDGLDTQLGRNFDDGLELSGGQWQKLALGRAMMRTEPVLLILDEPTASLDPQTEHALFERYAGAARRAAGQTGAITVLVSHRFSTVRMADLILVVDGGTITEVGSHAELVAMNGLYADLFELQARAYR